MDEELRRIRKDTQGRRQDEDNQSFFGGRERKDTKPEEEKRRNEKVQGKPSEKKQSLINSPKNMTRSQVERRTSSDEELGGRRLLRQGKRSR